MVVNGRPLKRMKRRITADIKDFLSFPVPEDEVSGQLDGPFRSNIKSFLTKHAQLLPSASLFPHLQIWQIVFRVADLIDGPESSPVVVTLDIVEEDVSRSSSVYCDQCRVVGWSGHPVCAKRYHFIIRTTKNSSIDGYLKPCNNCGDLLHLPDSRCKSCDYVMTATDLEEWVTLQLQDTSHLLHGVVHSNGYGHLLRVNGKEGGSKFVSGCDIMNFWDRICRTNRVRKISVMDVSKKYGLEYRLLHAITKGHPWYGDWGYEFGAGSFALTLEAYLEAVENLREIPLSIFFSDSRKPRTKLQNVISFYQSLSELELLTMRDLFCFVVKLIRETHEAQSPASNNTKKPIASSWALCSWSKDDIDHVEQAMVKVLRAVGGERWVSWRSLKGALYKIGSPQLLDYCLKDLGGKLAADGIVYTRCNPDTDALEYRINCEHGSGDDIIGCSSGKVYPNKDHLLRDLKFLHDSLLNPQTMVKYRPTLIWEKAVSSAAKLLDCKQFVKNYSPERINMSNPFAVRLLCEVELIDHPKDYTAPPPELIIVPTNASLADIKNEATKAFQEVYVLFRKFEVEDVLDLYFLGGIPTASSSDNLTIRVRGRCLGKNVLHRFRMERGLENWTVNCACGATDDDGERMLACDSCGVWQHTRCAGIHDFDSVPEKFMCGRCGGSGSRRRANVNSERKKSAAKGGNPKSDGRCKDESVNVEESSRRIRNSLKVVPGVK